ncbi:MAG: tRNA (adenosine(37)-N6)-dimethylallyltransferase MiaA [Nitrospinae bacterium]|nr:tRNA (adenosine(37)-N6)-dimethylallyltransferase MiaA [Nitrospinota bacterium]
MIPLIVLTGPTTSGKSKTALALARKLNTEIISADSMQVYKYFNIGTAKPSARERQDIPHHLIDIMEPDEEFNAFDFKTRALKSIHDLMNRNKIPILVGGTALYLKVLIQDYDCAVEISEGTRKKIQQDILEQGVERVYIKLQTIDPDFAEKISETDSLRIERALGVYMETGKPFSAFHKEDTASNTQFPIHTFILEWDRSELYEKIDQRVDDMIEDGLESEVKNILDRGFSANLKPFKSIGYSQMTRYHQGDLTLERAVYEIKRETRHYAKRQLTWFRKMSEAQIIATDKKDTPETLSEKLLSRLPNVAACLFAVFLVLGFGNSSAAKNTTQEFEQAKKLFLKKEWAKAKNQFLAIQNAAPDSMESKRSRFLLGLVHIQTNKNEQAIEALTPLTNNYPEIQDYILLNLARAELQNKNFKKAQDHALQLLKKFPETQLYPEAQILLAENYTQTNAEGKAAKILQEAIATLENSFHHKDFRPYLPELIFKLAVHQEKLGKKSEAYLNYRQLHIKYPNHELTPDAEAAIKKLTESPDVKEIPLNLREHTERIEELFKGVQYKEIIAEIGEIKKNNTPIPGRFYFFLSNAHRGLRDRKKANIALHEFSKLYPQHAQIYKAKFNIGRNLWNLGKPLAGAKYFKEVAENNPSSEQAIKALFFLGKIYEERKNYSESLKLYQNTLDKHPENYYGQWAGWRLGWINYIDGKFDKAFERFQDVAKRFPDSPFIEYNLYWSAKSAEKLKDKKRAREIFISVANLYPYTFHGIRAKEQMIKEGVSFPENHLENPNLNSPVKLGRALDPREKFHHIRAKELSTIGLTAEARNELKQLEKSIRKNLTGVLWLSNLYHNADGYSESLKLLHLYKDFATKSGERTLSPRFWKYFFPLAYRDAVASSSKYRNVDPNFVNGIIRQESLFDSNALSPAGARGLMQIMPATGKKLYPKTKLKKPFEADALFEPDLNIRLGVKYVSQLNKRFGENGTHILISYNAGPHVLKKWLKRFGHLNDLDVFIESIPYPETRRYVKHVLRNRGIYKALYSPS